ncbi:MAG: Translation initiation factor IF-2 [Thermotoga sp. 50_1627]|uniref:translation initiation factor IF-2 n=1 Tax=Pseudothermotoga sp. TaxID=2033661 RepID=UPI00076DABCD|nr:MAG: Translation initiation factor IF-2 [Thermotoga sp. 50_64]KUK25032.1 MAG: Translation initiation factor IF-2 [Thermotoga sp. 50_1627]MBC7116380.1 translation initiation factor IF-2 [Pseudothermotoga sp.]HBT39833.1 translation initiation factor IF-2 [Pseudothermotoga sp.]HCO97992.1 translation initiation factor IF-2 [Pseudothermotoga sp.]
MPRLRVYELAKKLNMSTKDLLQELEELGLDIKNHMSYIDEETVKLLLELFEEEEDVEKSKPATKPKKEEEIKEEEVREEVLVAPEELQVNTLALKMGVPLNKVIQDMFMKGVVLKPNQNLDERTAREIAKMYGYKLRLQQETKTEHVEEQISKLQQIEKYFEELYIKHADELVPRPPVVTVMGHVDHGKTTLLDKIRKTRVAEQEAGGITQSIGAYQISYNGKKITFIDTPGHELFTEMRARGAQATDIVVLVVAADDGVMPQTIEAYNHAKAANVPVVVAINKIDKPNANVEATKQQLVSKLNLIPEDWGGDTIVVPISARTGQGIDELLEMILLVAEMKEIKCYPKGPARCVVIESKIERGLGPVANVIVKDGILKVGDYVVAGPIYAKVRTLIDDKGKHIKYAEPSQPVMIVGFDELPNLRYAIYTVEDLETARQMSEEIKDRIEKERRSKRRMTLEELLKMMEEKEKKELNLILKADTLGSLSAVQSAVESLKSDEIKVSVVHAGVGPVTESDIMLASTCDGIVIGFRVKIEPQARKLAEAEAIQVKTYEVIYDLIESLKLAMEGMLKPQIVEELIGRGEIKKVFDIKKVGKVAGVQLLEGKATRDSKVKVYRNNMLLFTDEIETLKHFKEDVSQVEAPQECGIKFKNRADFQEGDELEFYQLKEIKRVL